MSEISFWGEAGVMGVGDTGSCGGGETISNDQKK